MSPISRLLTGVSVNALLLMFLVLLTQPGVASATSASGELTGVTIDQCSWDRPGHNPYQGDTAAAIDRYGDMDPATRARLKARIAKRDYDDMVTIRRDSIAGKGRYGASISDMYFGRNTICKNVSRAGWTEGMKERGLVYCDGPQCILVPTVCRNVSRISKAGVSPETASAVVPPAVPQVADDTAPTIVAAQHLGTPATFAEAAGLPAADGGSGGSDWPGAGSPGGGVVGGGGGSGNGGNGGGGGGGGEIPPVSPAPEPGTWLMMIVGLIGLAAMARQRTRLRRR